MSTRFAPLALTALLCAHAPALAQDDPELGETATESAPPSKPAKAPKRTPPPQSEPTPDTWGVPSESSANMSASSSDDEWSRQERSFDDERPGEREEKEDKGDTDHEKVVGSASFGLLGLAELPVGVGTPVNAPGGERTVQPWITSPLLGTRYWLGKRVGLEAGFGFMFRGGKITQTAVPEGEGGPSTRAFAVHVGLPIALVYGKHYNLILIPYGGFGTSKATDSRGTVPNADDVFGKGLLIEAGFRGGVEVQLGGIELEGLALQITGGLRLRYEKRSANIPVLDDDGVPTNAFDVETSETGFSTSQGSSLGTAIAGTLAALYYF